MTIFIDIGRVVAGDN